MRRLIGWVAFAIAFAWLAPVRSPAQQKSAGDDPVLERLEVILVRLTEIEKRLAKLERSQRAASVWWADGSGMLWSKDGRQIGFWGIDIVPTEAAVRR